MVAQIELEGVEDKDPKKRQKKKLADPKEGPNKGKYSEADDLALIRYVHEKIQQMDAESGTDPPAPARSTHSGC